jgi:hypothetical protein
MVRSALFALELATFGFTIPFLMTLDETFDVGVDIHPFSMHPGPSLSQPAPKSN